MNLIEGLQAEIKRVNEIIPYYEEIPTGIFAITLMKNSINNAEKAIAGMDTVAMASALKDLQTYEP